MDDILWSPDHPFYLDTAEDFFGVDPAADFNKWSRVQYWTPEEGVSLSFGFDPVVVNSNVLRGYPEHPFALEYDRRLDLAKRATEMGHLLIRNSPRKFIKWAKTVLSSFPESLNGLVNSAPVSKKTDGVLATSPSGLKTLVNKLSVVVLGMVHKLYGFNPKQPREELYEKIVADVRSGGIPLTIESAKHCLKPPDDLYENLPDTKKSLGKILLGLAICRLNHDPKASRTSTSSKIEKMVGDANNDTIRDRLKEAAVENGLA